MKVFYDLHIHSCLSPCGDDDMTPNNIVNMAKLKGLDIIALTDHNSCKNCPALVQVAQKAGLDVVPGMELCTSEECHVICLFPTLQAAMEFDAFIESTLPFIMNSTEAFGTQIIMDKDDNITGHFPILLATASSVSIDEVAQRVRSFGGTCFPAHIDRPSFSVISSLGAVPDAGFTAFEISPQGNADELALKYPVIKDKSIIYNSDAHTLSDIREQGPWIELNSPNPGILIKKLDNNKKLYNIF
ncbi:MAG: PHP domain-containing protein [Oscillospiraceae bacterium]|nr:PHP domain-containing protein [Oscillospiraceae bacterium]MDD4413595.1 PHP domain-containing protein [Oscillospiraceae bacterium]